MEYYASHMRYDGLQLKRIRMGKGLRQTQVAKATGVSQPSISEAESGQNQDPPMFKKLAKFYGVALADLIIEDAPKNGKRRA